jgi:hypothetical protein
LADPQKYKKTYVQPTSMTQYCEFIRGWVESIIPWEEWLGFHTYVCDASTFWSSGHPIRLRNKRPRFESRRGTRFLVKA